MNIYIVEFKGYYPVGAVAAVHANSPERAKDLLENELYTIGLAQSIRLDQFKQLLPGKQEHVDLLCDGNY